MGQSDSALFFNNDRTEVLIPCGCGSDDDRLRIGLFDPTDVDETVCMNASFAAQFSWRGRIEEAIRALKGNPHQDSMILSRKSVESLHAWLGELLENTKDSLVS